MLYKLNRHVGCLNRNCTREKVTNKLSHWPERMELLGVGQWQNRAGGIIFQSLGFTDKVVAKITET